MKDSQLDRDVIDATIEAFFKAVIELDSDMIQLIKGASGDISFQNGRLVFDLPSLYQLIVPSEDVSYQTFKKILYAGALNKTLAIQGKTIVVWHAANHIDATRYCLRNNLASNTPIQ